MVTIDYQFNLMEVAKTMNVKAESKYLSIDPGDTLGWAEFDEAGSLIGFGQEKDKDLVTWTDKAIHSGLAAVIVEDYKLMPSKSKAQSWSRMKTSKQIGKIELMAEMRDVRVVLQPNTVYRIGAMWGGFDIPSNHAISHQYVAAAHGIYYLQQHGIRRPGQGLKLNGNE